jgi:hypothetical protein
MWKSRMAEMADSLLTLFKHAQNQSRKGKPPNMWMISHLNKLCGSQGPFFLSPNSFLDSFSIWRPWRKIYSTTPQTKYFI